MNELRRCGLVLALSAATHGAWADGPPGVEVFSLSTVPLSHVGSATVYDLDAIALLEQALSAGLPNNGEQAQALVAQRLQALGPELRRRAEAGAAGLARAVQLGLDRAPAIVIDGRWVVYGITDVDAARQLVAARQRGQR